MVLPLAEIPAAELQLELIRRGEVLPVKITEPLKIAEFPLWQQIDLAVRLIDPESELSFIYEEIVPAGASGWVTAEVPEDRVCWTLFFTEWGDPCLKVKHAYNTRDNLYIGLHYVPPVPTTFQKVKHWTFGKKWFLYRENTDLVNPAEYHLVSSAIIPREVARARYNQKLGELARLFLEGA